jgi:hypothetical protein
MNVCPFCDQVLLQQFRKHRLTLFCQHCWEEIPLAKAEFAPQKLASKVISLNQVRSSLHFPGVDLA